MKYTDTPPRARPDSTSNKPSASPADTALKTCPCGIPENTPTYNSFAHIRNPKVRRAKEYEQHLLFMRDMFPEYNQGIDEQIAYAKSQQERSHSSDRDRVLQILERGEVTCRELAEDLSMPYATAYKILKEYLEAGICSAREHKGLSGNKPYLVYSTGHAL